MTGTHETALPASTTDGRAASAPLRRIGFDRAKYIDLQSQHIQERRRQIGGKLYLEMGGKLFDDLHASRVLPGFTPDNKIAMLERIKDETEILVCFNAKDLERNKVRADLGITYEDDVLRLVDVFRERGFLVEHVVVTQLEDANHRALAFLEKLERLGLKVARHRVIPGYPHATARIVSEEGFGRNEWSETTRDLVVVTAPGPGSGKLATCLSQVYHDHQRGLASSYAKFETFPIWDLPLEHPVNVAYEAATADLDDINLIDPFHLAAHGEQVGLGAAFAMHLRGAREESGLIAEALRRFGVSRTTRTLILVRVAPPLDAGEIVQHMTQLVDGTLQTRGLSLPSPALAWSELGTAYKIQDTPAFQHPDTSQVDALICSMVASKYVGA